MSTITPERVTYELMVLPFPAPGQRVQLAYRELNIAANGTEEQKQALGIGDILELPRPWAPETCQDPELRHEVWTWLDEVVTWLNHEYSWDIAPLIPSCWPRHPHIIHEVAVVADQRRRAGMGVTSDPLEEWHRYCLPTFLDRMRNRLKDHCNDGHRAWPGSGRHIRHTASEARDARENIYALDLDALTAAAAPRNGVRMHKNAQRPAARFSVVNTETGEILDDLD